MFKITIPTNKSYTGVVAGVAFVNGEAETDDNWKADWFKENNYKVEEKDQEEKGQEKDKEEEKNQEEGKEEKENKKKK